MEIHHRLIMAAAAQRVMCRSHNRTPLCRRHTVCRNGVSRTYKGRKAIAILFVFNRQKCWKLLAHKSPFLGIRNRCRKPSSGASNREFMQVFL